MATVTACSSGRSVEAFCGELDRGVAEMSGNSANATEDMTGQLMLALDNVGEFTRMLNRLADFAPEEIRGDMETVAESWSEQAEMMSSLASDPLGALVATFMQSVMTSASYTAVDQFALENCGSQIFGAANPGAPQADQESVATPEPTQSPSTSPVPAVGDSLALPVDLSNHLTSEILTAGDVIIYTNRSGEETSVATFDARTGEMLHDLTTLPIMTSWSPPCPTALAPLEDGRVLFVGFDTEWKPPEGVYPGIHSGRVAAYDTATMNKVWSYDVGVINDDCPYMAFGTSARHLYLRTAEESGLLDVRTGSFTQFDDEVIEVWGDFLVMPGSERGLERIVSMETLQQVGEVSSSIAKWADITSDAFIDDRSIVEAVDYNNNLLWENKDYRSAGVVSYLGGEALIVSKDSGGFARVDPKTGAEIWGIEADVRWCGATETQFVVMVGLQIALINLDTGTQELVLDRLPQRRSDDCPLPFNRGLIDADGVAHFTVPTT